MLTPIALMKEALPIMMEKDGEGLLTLPHNLLRLQFLLWVYQILRGRLNWLRGWDITTSC